MDEDFEELFDYFLAEAASTSGSEHESQHESQCDHDQTYTTEAGVVVCKKCSEQILEQISLEQDWRYYGDSDNKNLSDPGRTQFRKNADKGIFKDLEKLNLPTDIINIADEYYFKVTNGEIKRSNLRKGIMFACVFEAYKDINNPQTPEALGAVFKMPQKSMRKIISKGFTYFHLNNKNKKFSSGHMTPENFIPKILDLFCIKEEFKQEVIDLYRKLQHKSKTLNRSMPQSVGSGLVYYYFKKKNIDIPVSKFGKKVNLSEITITKIAAIIEELLS
jgi:transcription initiation factor TFIIIB Brf1 subunit/transcription initiation factor TFIIB